MARSVFYYHLKHLKDKDKYVHEKELIKAIYHEHKGRYGYRRVTAEMRNRGFTTNHKTVRRLMDEMELRAESAKSVTAHTGTRPARQPPTSSPGTSGPKPPTANGPRT